MEKVILALTLLACIAARQMRDSFGSMQRLVGGQNATLGQFPYIVDLQREDLGGHFCGGGIYNKWTVITAGHCLEVSGNVSSYAFKNLHLVTIIAGQLSKTKNDSTEQVRRVKRAVPHPKWLEFGTFAGKYDIGVIIVDSPFVFNEYVGAVQIASREEVANSAMAIGIGWGFTSGCSGDDLKWTRIETDILKTSLMPLLTDEECIEWQTYERDINTINCMGSVGYSTAYGDSGSPISVEVDGCLKLLGPVSFGISACNGVDGPSFPMKASFFKDWIEEQAMGPPEGECKA